MSEQLKSDFGDLAVIILGAGLGTRMQSALPKVLHPIAGQSMLAWVQAAAQTLNPLHLITVLGPEAPDLPQPGPVVIQHERRGTGHAVQLAVQALGDFRGWVLVLFGDTALIRPETLTNMLNLGTDKDADLVVAGFRPDDPARYGRLVLDGERLTQIVEFKDANPAQRALDLCNGGLMALRAPECLKRLDRLDDQNAAGELYLTEMVALTVADGGRCLAYDCDEADVKGINTRQELAEVEALMQDRLRRRIMAGGVTLQDPRSVTLSYDTHIGAETYVEPYQIFGPGVRIGAGARVRGFCHLEQTDIGDGAQIGPFARLRPGAVLGQEVRVGNFVEVKNAQLDKGAKVNHLSYIGDAQVGAAANVGAGTITCNYDGYQKHETHIGAGAFIGSNTALVAPLRVGAGAIIGAGSTLTKDVPDQALALSRADQRTLPKGAAQLRKKLSKSKP